MKDVIVLFGKPGAGKGTRLDEFLEGRENQFDSVGVSGLLKKEIADGTKLGQKAKSYMDSGSLVPDELIITMVLNRLENAKKPVFLDGFPRTVPQAKAMLEAGIVPTMVVEFILDDAIILERLRNRVVCTSCNTSYNLVGAKRPKVDGICDKCGSVLARRKDDSEEVALNRFEVYFKQTYPCLSVFATSNIPVHTIDNSNSETAQKHFAELMSTL